MLAGILSPFLLSPNERHCFVQSCLVNGLIGADEQELKVVRELVAGNYVRNCRCFLVVSEELS
jgi:hypothetical protein